MKFACDRCGKRFASVDEPAAGRVYRIRCRCGHVIVVRGPAASPRVAADVQIHGFEEPPLPPPLATPAPEEPPSAGDPPRPLGEGSRSLDPPPAVAVAGEATAPARQAPAAPIDESPVQDDPRSRAKTPAEPYTMGPAVEDQDWTLAPRPPLDRDEEPGADSGAAIQIGAAALPAVAARSALSFGLGADGASGARRRIILAAFVALAAAAALAVSRM